ncbi:hypothetical protein J5X07_04005 [Actinomyces bowdenii]|uniref:hypothetical protein n=1 Tax=Actinomyces bowdenii TaxID=131109 RepID=UPI001ABCA21A|nr:hypothetical protein [Actinomyces bowdenii]MBO3724199.1 hypothetical protein [Actinomyces bowdenii]
MSDSQFQSNNSELSIQQIEDYIPLLNTASKPIAPPPGGSKASDSDIGSPKRSFQLKNTDDTFKSDSVLSFKKILRLEESKRKSALNDAFIEDLRTGLEMRNKLASEIIRLTKIQVWVVNGSFMLLAVIQAVHGMWPSDKVILGWFASTVVEIIGLYAIVLRGVFAPSSLSDVISQVQR